LEKKKDTEYNKLCTIKNLVVDKENNLSNKFIKYKSKLNKFESQKDKWNEFNDIYKSDKKIYSCLKKKIENNDLIEENISDLFKSKFSIFKKMDEEQLLDKENEIYKYIDIASDDIINPINFISNHKHKNDDDTALQNDDIASHNDDDDTASHNYDDDDTASHNDDDTASHNDDAASHDDNIINHNDDNTSKNIDDNQLNSKNNKQKNLIDSDSDFIR